VASLSDSALMPLSLAGVTSVAVACAVCGGAFLLQMASTLSRRQVRQLRADGTVLASHPV
jgi:hypothetical protein